MSRPYAALLGLGFLATSLLPAPAHAAATVAGSITVQLTCDFSTGGCGGEAPGNLSGHDVSGRYFSMDLGLATASFTTTCVPVRVGVLFEFVPQVDMVASIDATGVRSDVGVIHAIVSFPITWIMDFPAQEVGVQPATIDWDYPYTSSTGTNAGDAVVVGPAETTCTVPSGPTPLTIQIAYNDF